MFEDCVLCAWHCTGLNSNDHNKVVTVIASYGKANRHRKVNDLSKVTLLVVSCHVYAGCCGNREEGLLTQRRIPSSKWSSLENMEKIWQDTEIITWLSWETAGSSVSLEDWVAKYEIRDVRKITSIRSNLT